MIERGIEIFTVRPFHLRSLLPEKHHRNLSIRDAISAICFLQCSKNDAATARPWPSAKGCNGCWLTAAIHSLLFLAQKTVGTLIAVLIYDVALFPLHYTSLNAPGGTYTGGISFFFWRTTD